jgi:uncharacterized membrane protein
MPYCCQCGNQVAASDRYCRTCGASQAAAGTPANAANAPPGGYPPGFPPGAAAGFWTTRNASRLCYFPWLGWIACVLVLATHRFQRDYEVRFHAFQGLYLFVAWLLVDWVVSPMLRMTGYGFWQPMPFMGGGVLHLLIFVAWIVMFFKTKRGEHYRLPILGDLAERTVAEQRVG